VVITFGGWEYDRSIYEPLIEEFNKQNPNITVQFVDIPITEEPINDYDRLTASSGDTFIAWTISYFHTDYLHDLQPLLEADTTFEADDFWPGALEGCQDLEGRQLGIPTTLNVQGIYYAPEAFDAAGLPRPKAGWTWDEFRKDAIALAKRNGDTIRYGYAEGLTTVLLPLVENELQNADGKIDPQELQASIQWYIDLVKERAIHPSFAYEDDATQQDQQWNDWQTMFRSPDRPVMWPGGLGESLPGDMGGRVLSPSNLLDGSALMTDGFLPYPISADNPNDHTTPVYAECAVISAGAEHPREVWAWLNFLSRQDLSPEYNNPWDRLQLPARQSATDAVNYWDGLSAEVKDSILFAVDHGMYGSYYAEKAAVVLNAVSNAASGKGDFVTLLEQKMTELAAATTPSPTPNTTPIVVATPRPTLSPDANVINYFYSAWGPDRDAMDALIQEYNQAHTDVAIKLSVDLGSGGKRNNDYMAGMAEAFDCFTYYTPYWPQTNDGNFLSLDSLVAAERPDFLPDFDQPMLAQFTRNGQLYALPASSQPQVMAYNADLLARRGLQPPANDWAFDNFIDLATRVTLPNENDLSYGLIFGEWDEFLFNGRGIHWYDGKADPPATLFDTLEFTNGLAWIMGLKDSGVLLVQSDDNWEQIQSAMENGQVAFWTTQVEALDYGWFYNGAPSFKIGLAPVPVMEDPELAAGWNWASEMGHFISAKTKNAQGCWDWIKFMSEQPTVFSGIPARKSVAASSAWEAKVGVANAAVYRAALAQVVRTNPEGATNNDRMMNPYYAWKLRIVRAALKGDDYMKEAAKMQQTADDYRACMATVDASNMTDDEYYNEVIRCAQQVDPDGDWVPSGGGGQDGG
jgi:ABC-type glycerol-3-phosphate transport system substrate-binding protein